MHYTFHKNIKWVSVDSKTIIKSEPFKWGSELIEPGEIFKKLGDKKRTSFKLTDASLKYTGRIGSDLYFAVINAKNQSSENDGWYVELSFVNNTTLLAQTTNNAFYDIRY